MDAKKSARQHARKRGALDGADAQAWDGALSPTERERDEARRELDEARRELDEARRERDKARLELGRMRDRITTWLTLTPAEVRARLGQPPCLSREPPGLCSTPPGFGPDPGGSDPG